MLVLGLYQPFIMGISLLSVPTAAFGSSEALTIASTVIFVSFCSHGHGPYHKGPAGATWRVSFALLIPLVLYVLYYRVYVLKELKLLSSVKKRDGVQGQHNLASFGLAVSFTLLLQECLYYACCCVGQHVICGLCKAVAGVVCVA